MRPIVIPDGWFPGERREIVGGENGTEPAEYVVESDPDYGMKVTTLVQLDSDEAAEVGATGYLFLTMFGGEMPWNIRPAPGLGAEWSE